MAIKTINLRRIEELVRGEQPDGIHEELFVVAFKTGLGGESFMVALLQISDIFEGLSHQDKDYFNLGYALGQKTFAESNTDEHADRILYADSNKKTTH